MASQAISSFSSALPKAGGKNPVNLGAVTSAIITDGHAPAEYRADTVRNISAWYQAFGVKPADKLYLALKIACESGDVALIDVKLHYSDG